MKPGNPRTVRFRIRGPIDRADLPGLYARVCRVLGTRPAVVLCDLGGVRVDAVMVEALGRLQLAAQRHGCEVRLERPSEDLLGLIAFMGLVDVLAA
jgi:ABC-type transporter Mla MlaB component